MPSTRPAPELPPGPRAALVVGTGSYLDAELAALRSPARDAAELAAVLGDEAIGGFAVTVLTDPDLGELRRGIQRFLASRSVDDVVVVYLSCHGVLSARRHLYFAARDTDQGLLEATGLEARWLIERLDDCKARRQVVLLDCCFSGAFARTKAGGGAQDVGLEDAFGVPDGRGRTVLTASRDTEYSFEGEKLPDGTVAGSVFTAALVEGLRSGAADVDRDGLVSVADAYAFVHGQVRDAGAAQTPQQWTYGGEGKVVLARSAAGIEVPDEAPVETAPAALGDETIALLASTSPRLRLAAVEDLGDRLESRDQEQARVAREALRRVSDRDDPQVADVARKLLRSHSPEGKVSMLLDEAEHLLSAEIPPDMQAPFFIHMAATAPATDPRRERFLGAALRRVERYKLAPDIDRQRAAIAEAIATVYQATAVDLAYSIEDDLFLKARTLARISGLLTKDVHNSTALFQDALSLMPNLTEAQAARIRIVIAASYPDVESYRNTACDIRGHVGDPQDEITLLVDAAALLPRVDPRRLELLQRAEALNVEGLPSRAALVAGWAPVDLYHARRLAMAMPDGVDKVRALLAVAAVALPTSPLRALLAEHAEKTARALPIPELRAAMLAESAAVLPAAERRKLLAEVEDIIAGLPEGHRVQALTSLARAWSEVGEP